MHFGLVVFMVIVAGLFLVRLVLNRRRMEETSRPDAGAAIVAFGTAFPDEAIREVVRTADGKAAFFRLADEKTGFLRHGERRDVARIIEPGDVQMSSPVGDSSLSVALDGADAAPTTFDFSTPQDAAEVALWLFGSFSSASGSRFEKSE